MTSLSIFRTIQSPSRAMIKPGPAKSILKRPSPLPISPVPFSFSSISVFLSPLSAEISPHVHFPPSPAMAATFTTHSANSYDRRAIIISHSPVDTLSWGSRAHSPSAETFRLSDPPKRTASATRLPRKNLTVPPFEDPRSPKPYLPRTGLRFEELAAQAPRGFHAVEDLSKALSSYPRSPYPSAPISSAEEFENPTDDTRGRTIGRVPNQSSRSTTRSLLPTRARSLSLEVKPKRRQAIGSHVSSPLNRNFLSPVQESPLMSGANLAPYSSPESASPESARLNRAFWQSVVLDDENRSSPIPAVESLGSFAPPPPIIFGNKDGSLWSPGLPKKDRSRLVANMETSMLSPGQRVAFSKSLVASPSPNDPFAAFPSFSVALMSGLGGPITHPPRALVGRN